LTLEESIGAVLRECREKRGLTQEALAFRAGLHRTYISMLERGQKSPTVDVLARLALAMETRVSDILRQAEKALALGEHRGASACGPPRRAAR
jgi:transcriptional regulator with XRE-family HTH domain